MDKSQLAILGLGSRSTLFYLEEINKQYNLKKGGFSTCPFVLLNVDFDTINPLLPNTSIKLDAVVQSYMKSIDELAVDSILVPNITLHETLDRLVIHKSVIHPLKLSTLIIKQHKWTQITLFGSLYAMRSSYIRSFFENENIEVITPNQEDMFLIDEVRKQIYHQTESKELIARYHLLIEKYSANYPVVLACTELSVLNTQSGTKNLLDMAQVQIEEFVKQALES